MWQFFQESTTDDDVLANVSEQFVACMVSGSYKLVIEMEIILRDIDNLPDAVVLFFCLHYVLDLCYVKHKKRELYFFEFIQKVLFGLDSGKLSPGYHHV